MNREMPQGEGDWVQMLRAKPVRNAAARVVENREKSVTILVKQKRPSFLIPPLSWIVPFSPERQVTLDELGTRVWKLCDGQSTVEQIVEAFRAPYRLTFHEGRAAVTGYVSRLIQRGVIAIVMQEEP